MTDTPENQEPARKRGQKIAASSIDRMIGMRIRIARNMAGKKQDELARYLGLTLQQTQKYENGKNKISVNILVKIAKYFQIPVSYFIPSQHAVNSSQINQTIKTLESIDTVAMHNVAENWQPIGNNTDKPDNNLQSLIQEITAKGLEGDLYQILQTLLNKKK